MADLAVESAKAATEAGLEALIEAAGPGLKTALTQKIKDLIPGEAYDGVADLMVPQVFEIVKMELLKQVDKISDQV